MIYVDIDELTPCLTDSESGEIVETEVVRIKRKSFLSKYNKKTGWYINWADLLQNNEIFALVIKGSVAIQGLIAVRPDKDTATAFASWMVAAPQNNTKYTQQKKYKGVGGHLFTIAAQRSLDYGFNCAISGFAANSYLLKHYIDTFNAEPIGMLHPYQFFISEKCGKKIKEVYDYDWTDEII